MTVLTAVAAIATLIAAQVAIATFLRTSLSREIGALGEWMTRLEDQMARLVERVAALEQRFARMEGRLDEHVASPH